MPGAARTPTAITAGPTPALMATATTPTES
jgi:hypothetical protein